VVELVGVARSTGYMPIASEGRGRFLGLEGLNADVTLNMRRYRMTVKEKLVEIVRAEGYDFITACEVVTNALQALSKGRNVLRIGRVRVVVVKK